MFPSARGRVSHARPTSHVLMPGINEADARHEREKFSHRLNSPADWHAPDATWQVVMLLLLLSWRRRCCATTRAQLALVSWRCACVCMPSNCQNRKKSSSRPGRPRASLFRGPFASLRSGRLGRTRAALLLPRTLNPDFKCRPIDRRL